MTRLTQLSIFSVAALGVMTAVVPFATGSSVAAASTGAGAKAAVTPGINASTLPGATITGATPASTKETVSFVLREQHLPTLKAAVERGVSKFLSVAQFSSLYGQTAANIGALQTYLAGYHIKTSVDTDNVDVVAHGTVGEFNRALSVRQSQFHVPAVAGHDGMRGIPAQNVHGTTQAPKLPQDIARNVAAILGLTNYGPFTSQAVHTSTSLARPNPDSANSCIKLSGLPAGCNLPSNFATNYGLDSLYKKGADGSGQTLAIVTLATLDHGAPQHFWTKVAHIPATGRTLTVTKVDGGSGAPSDAAGTGETDLDVEQSPTGSSRQPARTWPAPSRPAGSNPRPSWPPRSPPASSRPATRPRSTRPSWKWPSRARPASSPPVTGAPTPPASTSAPPTCRWAPRPTAPTSPRPAAPHWPGTAP
jgi:hypothetical protein